MVPFSFADDGCMYSLIFPKAEVSEEGMYCMYAIFLKSDCRIIFPLKFNAFKGNNQNRLKITVISKSSNSSYYFSILPTVKISIFS